MKSIYSLKKIQYIIACMILLATVLPGCKKMDDIVPFVPERNFTPTSITATGGETQAVITWKKSLFGQTGTSYKVEISATADFSGPIAYTADTDTTQLIVTDANLALQTPYYARVRANANGSIDESAAWAVTTNTFTITGEQLFLNIPDADISTQSVLLKWREGNGLTRITITPTAGGTTTEHVLDATAISEREKLITGLQPTTQYRAELFRGTVNKGLITFTTKTPSIYTTVLSPGDDLVAAVANAASGDVIGLDPGTYDCKDGAGVFINIVVQEKNISIYSVSDNPANTIVNFKEIYLRGTGAGIHVKGITFDGGPANAPGAAGAPYFINLGGAASDATAANFADIVVENSVVKNFGNCFMRANRATANGGHKVGNIKVHNSQVFDCLAISAYTFFTLEKLEFRNLELTNSTFYNLGRAFIGASTNFAMAAAPTIKINQCTINSFGRDARNNFFIDANTNPVSIDIQNTIIANTPIPGQTTGTSLARASAANPASITYCNMFKLTDGAATPAPVTFPAIFSQSNNQSIDLGWTGTTTNFSLPAGSPLRTAGSTGGPVGDPRWAL